MNLSITIRRSSEFGIDKTDDTPLTVEGRDEFKQLVVCARWDGCTHIETFCNGSFEGHLQNPDDRDYLHICDLPQFIKQLIQIHEEAHKTFGDEYWIKPEYKPQ